MNDFHITSSDPTMQDSSCFPIRFNFVDLSLGLSWSFWFLNLLFIYLFIWYLFHLTIIWIFGNGLSIWYPIILISYWNRGQWEHLSFKLPPRQQWAFCGEWKEFKDIPETKPTIFCPRTFHMDRHHHLYSYLCPKSRHSLYSFLPLSTCSQLLAVFCGFPCSVLGGCPDFHLPTTMLV